MHINVYDVIERKRNVNVDKGLLQQPTTGNSDMTAKGTESDSVEIRTAN